MVADTLGTSWGSAARSRRRIVLLPTPEGPEMTTSLPGRTSIPMLYREFAAVEKSAAESPSLDVLDLLAKPLDAGLELDDGVGRLHVEGFRGDRVGLAGQFLRQEIERSAR